MQLPLLKLVSENWANVLNYVWEFFEAKSGSCYNKNFSALSSLLYRLYIASRYLLAET